MNQFFTKASQSFTDTLEILLHLEILLPLSYPQHKCTDQGKPYQRQNTKTADTDTIN